jgi:hypothetical protein
MLSCAGEFALSLMAAMPQGAWGLPPPAPTSGSRGDRGADAENQAPADAVEEGLQVGCCLGQSTDQQLDT